LARDVVRLKPDAILTTGVPMAPSLKAATGTIPIVALTGDPIRYGLVASLARPGAAWISFLGTPFGWQTMEGQVVREAAQRAGILVLGSFVDEPMHEADYRRAFASISQQGAGAILVSATPDNFSNRRLIVELAAKARLATMFAWREPVEDGGLMAYAVDVQELWRHAARQIDQILKGASPGETKQPSSDLSSISRLRRRSA
jgi:putative tryptophan/tyrosine transport system substrate-binding protein